MKKNGVIILGYGMFAAIGILFTVIGVKISMNTFNYENKVETTGTITSITSHRDSDGDTSHTVYVSYEVDGVIYESSLGGYSSSYKKGKEIEIYYDKDDPYEIGTKSIDLLMLLFPGLGLIFAIIGLVGLIKIFVGKSKSKRLKEKGQAVYATITSVELNTSYTVNGSNPYYILCEWNNPTDGKKYIFKSENIWFDPQTIMSERNITQLPVYIDSAKLNNYYVDIDTIKNNVVDMS